MKKITLLTATALALVCISGQPIATLAASNTNLATSSKNCIQSDKNGNKIIFTYSTNCDIQNILDQLENCFPEINLPEVEKPENNIPEAEIPENNTPENNIPEINIPDTNIPENDNNSNDNITEDTTPEETPEEDSSNNNMHAFVQEVVNLVNAERAKEGLSPLTINTKVQAAAQVRAVECEQSFSHTRPNGTSFSTALKEQNVSYQRAGENIAWGQRSPKEVMNGWMNSEGHRANIMNPNFTTIGVGYYQNAKGTNYWCQLFTK